MASIGSIVAKLQLNIDNFTANMKNAEAQIKKVEDKFSGYDAIGGRFTDIGQKLSMGLTLPLAGAAAAATNVAATFEEKLSKVKAISGATAEDMELLKQKSMEMGAATKFSAGESADAMTYMAMAGWDATAMVEGIGGIMNLAAADGLDLATTSDIVTDSLTAFGLQAKDSAKFADVLAMAASASNTSVQMLGESFKYVAPVAGALGYSAEDTSIALGIMANSGIKASQAGTSLRAAISRMIKPTDDAAGLMDELGISMTNSDGSMKSLGEVMGILRTQMGGLSEAEQAQAAATLFGQEAMSGMLAIINASEGDFNKLTESIYNSEGVAQQMAETMQDNLKGKIEQLGGALETFGILIGDMIIPVITNVVEKVTGWVDKFTQMDETTRKVILVVGGLVASVGPVLLIIGKSIETFGKMQATLSLMKKGFTALGNSQVITAAKTKIVTAAQTALNAVMAINPVYLVIAGIVALIAVFVLLWKKCDWFREFWINLWNIITEKASQFWEWFKGIFSNVWESIKAGWETAKTGFMKLWNSISTWFSALWESIVAIVQVAVDWFVETFGYLFEGISAIWEGIIQYFTGAWEIIKNIFMGALLIIIDLVTLDFTNLWTDIANIWENIKAGFSLVWEGIKNIFSGALTIIGNTLSLVWNAITTVISTVWNGIVNFFVTIWNIIATSVSTAWNGFLNIIKTVVSNIYNTVVQWFNNVVSWLAALPGRLYTMGANMFNSMKNGVTSTIGGIYNAVVNGVQRAINWIIALPGQAVTWGRHMIEGFIDGILGAVGRLVDTVKGVGSKIRDFLGFSIPKKGPLHVYMEWMPHMIQGMTKSLQAEAPTLYDAASSVAGGLSDSMQSTSATVPTSQASGSSEINQLSNLLTEFMQKVGQPTAIFQLNGREFAQATVGDMSKALAERTR